MPYVFGAGVVRRVARNFVYGRAPSIGQTVGSGA